MSKCTHKTFIVAGTNSCSCRYMRENPTAAWDCLIQFRNRIVEVLKSVQDPRFKVDFLKHRLMRDWTKELNQLREKIRGKTPMVEDTGWDV